MKEKFVILLFFSFCNYFFIMFGTYLLFLKLNLELMGLLALINSIIYLGFTFYEIGFTTIHYRYSVKRDYNQYLSAFLLIKIILILISITFCFVLIIISHLWQIQYFFYFFLNISSMIISSLINVLITNLRIKKKILIVAISFAIYTFAKNSSLIFLALNISIVSDPLLYIFLSNFIFDLLFIILLIRSSKGDLLNLAIPSKEILLFYLKKTKFIALRVIIFVLIINISNLLVNYFYGLEYLAFILFIYQVNLLLNLISQSFIPIYLRFYTEYFENNSITSIEEIAHKVEKYSSILFLFIIMTIFLNGRLILSNFLPEYLPTLSGLYIIIFIPYLMGITRPYENQLVPGDKEKIFALIGILIGLMQLIMIFLLIPKNLFGIDMLGLGMVGYGLAMTIPWVLYPFLCYYFSKKYFNIKSEKQKIFHIILAIFTFLFSFIIKNYILRSFIKNEILLLIITSLILLAIFIGLLGIFKQLKRSDLFFFIELFKIKLYKDSIKEEILN